MVQGAERGNIIFRNRHRSFVRDEQAKQNKQAESLHKKHIQGEKPIQLPRIQLVVAVNDHYERKLSLAFWNEATTGMDAGMDAEAFEIAATDAGWLHDNISLVIDVRPFDILDEIPLFLKVGDGGSKMTFSQRISENIRYQESLYIRHRNKSLFFY